MNKYEIWDTSYPATKPIKEFESIQEVIEYFAEQGAVAQYDTAVFKDGEKIDPSNFIMSKSQVTKKSICMSEFLRHLMSRKDDGKFFIVINKQQAKDLLSIRDKTNRPLSSTQVAEMVEKINAGKWVTKETEPIWLSYYDELLIDGQHRLKAFIESNKSEFTTFVQFG